MFGIFATEESSVYTPILLDPHTTSPGDNDEVIVRNSQKTDGAGRESELFHRARQIYYRGRRSSARRSAGII